jgi:chromate transporter
MSSAPVDPPPPALRTLFAGFFGIGMMGFGGVLPWARRMVVDQRRWLTPAEFTDMLALCQFLPGPNIVNMSVTLGARFHGLAGALTCFAGLMVAPSVIVLCLGAIYDHFAGLPQVGAAFAGLAAAASGLIVSMAVKVATPLWGNWPGVAMASVCFVAVVLLRFPLVATLLVLAPISVAMVYWAAARTEPSDAADKR